MSERTAEYYEIVKRHISKDQLEDLLFKNRPPFKANFTKDAYSIVRSIADFAGHLHSCKKAYCSLEPKQNMSPDDRLLIDEKTQLFVSSYLDKLKTLKSDRRNCPHSAAIIVYLEKRLSLIPATLKEFKTLVYQQEKLKAKLLQPSPSVPDHALYSADSEEASRIQHLSSAERLLLEKENQEILRELTGVLDELDITHQKIEEISQLQQILESNIQMQSEHIEHIYDDSIKVSDNVLQGNQYLVKAKDHSSDFRKFVLFFLILASVVLLFLNWYD